MRRTFPSTRRAITLAVISGLSVTALSAAAQDEPVEEIVVTGSYFRGSPLDAPSPVQVIDRSSIEAQGAAVIWDVIKNLEVNSGSISNPGSGDNTQVSGSANVNLRNLGENSTLTLINGKRMVPAAVTTRSGGEFVDLNSIPLVMTDRVEVLTDGGSALYGADAVAGVVNIIMRTTSKASSCTATSKVFRKPTKSTIRLSAPSGAGQAATATLTSFCQLSASSVTR